MKYFFAITVFICSCGVKSDHENSAGAKMNQIEAEQDSLTMFPVERQMHFVATNSKDQIALLFKRETADTFSYRIELLRKWRGLPFGHGRVKLAGIDADSIYSFKGGSSDCDVMISISLKRNGALSANLARTCKDKSMDINLEEFPDMWNKGGK